MPRPATLAELQMLLSKHPMLVLSRVGDEHAHLSIPTDGRGLRVLVETRTDALADRVPDSLRVRVRGHMVYVPLEARATAQDYEAL